MHVTTSARVVAQLAIPLAFLSACAPAAATMPPGLTLEQLANAEYDSPVPAEGTIRLTDGAYRQTAAAGAASEIVVSLLPDGLAFGDLDGDGLADAVALLAGSGGGSGTFISLAALRNEGGAPRHVATAFLGDRVQVTSMTIDSGEITVSLISHAPTDPLCCPTKETIRRFRLDSGRLVETTATP